MSVLIQNCDFPDDRAIIWAHNVIHRARWRPIATAPKDGTLILLGNANDPKWPLRCRLWDGETFGHWRGQDGDEATHWMPLPAPPVAE